MILTPIVIADAPACKTPDHGVVMVKAAQPTYPNSARILGSGTVTTLVQVTIDANGNVANAQILKTSSLAALDQEALRVARASEYSPTIVNCTPQSADATLTITLAPDGPDLIMVAGAAGNEAASGCPTPNREPAIVEQVTPELSGIESHITGPTSVTVRVSLDPNGRVNHVDVVNSSGDRLLDDAVIRAARLSKYTAHYVDCKPVAGEYILQVKLE